MLIGTKELDNQIFYDTAIKLYNSKAGLIRVEEIAKELHIAPKWLQKRNRIKQKENYLSFPDVTCQMVRTFDLFDSPLTTKGAYWLGYIMADGCIAPQHYDKSDSKYRLILDLSVKDIEILYNLCETLQIRKSRIGFGHNGASVTMTLQEDSFTTFVTEYGISTQKSKKENHIDNRILKNDSLLLAFFHGYMDGDGTVHPYKNSPGVSVVGDKTFEEELKAVLAKILPCPSSIFINMTSCYKNASPNSKYKINMQRPLYQLKIGSGYHKRENLRFLYDCFYNQTDYLYLTRKKLVFEQALGSL